MHGKSVVVSFCYLASRPPADIARPRTTAPLRTSSSSPSVELGQEVNLLSNLAACGKLIRSCGSFMICALFMSVMMHTATASKAAASDRVELAK